MKIKELIASLKGCCGDSAEREAYLIIEQIFNVSYAALISDKERDFDKELLIPIIEKRNNRIPLQYIFGEWYFMGEKFYVSPDCLIPRPDTEILVEKAIKCTKPNARIVDLCTGSGCIGISVLDNRKDIKELTLVDISAPALDMARKNAALHGVADKCEFVLADVTKDILIGKYDAILSNPPYILSKDMDTLSPEVKNEPYIALCGGEDGLDIIKPIVYNSSSHLNEGGILLIEFGYDQGEAMDSLLSVAVLEGLYSSYEILKDYGGNVRTAYIVK
ncbi:MAG: peptide chain release factor N(5)-glutamine methyltransferase [Clostridia bacterium]|nr:peptide chain release factor N(5)-glutamine methyltransferase [Clostridia bacterium]